MITYPLPFDISKLNEDGAMINMSELNFDVPINQQKKASFIFLRNAGIKAGLDFSQCSFVDKEEFLLLYLQEDIDVNADILSTTWIEILSAKDGGGVVLPSILSANEIQMFNNRNTEFISELMQLINSLPIYSMYCSPLNGSTFTMDEFERTDYDKVKITNFSKLSRYDAFMLLIEPSTSAKFYEKLFIKDESKISEMMDRLPYLNILTAIFAPQEVQDQLASGLSQILTPPNIIHDKEE